MWKRTLLFVVLCLAAFGSLSAMLLRPPRMQTPRQFDEHRFSRPEYRAVLERVDREFHEDWRQKGLQSAALADDRLIARRLALGLLGTVPSLEELRTFDAKPPEQRLEWWLSRLLEDRRFSDYLAERLARTYVGTDQGPFLLFRRRRFVTWLSDQLTVNRAYDEIVRELITAHGLWTDAPAVNFVTATADPNDGNQPNEIKLAGRTARAFLATRVDCLQCHDDKLGTVQLGSHDQPRDGMQTDFHQLAAFFCQARTSLFGISDVNQQDYKFKYLNAKAEEVVKPRPPFSPELLPAVPNRRDQLARWVTDRGNKPFARAIVNRMWALMAGRPLVEPIDNIPLHGPFPPGLETLADDFASHQYDLRRLIRLIAATEAFRLDSRAAFALTEAHEPAWACFPLTRLRPEQVAGGLLQAASLSTIDANAHILSQLTRFFQQNNFVERYGDIGEDEFTTQPGTITQRLLLMNGELVKDRTQDNPVLNAATRIAMLAPTDEKAVEVAYLATLTRSPTDEERSHFSARLTGLSGNERSAALEDLYWVLINCSEFSWNH